MRLRHFQLFITVAEELNFRRAAHRLHVAQPALSRSIRTLEEELKLELLSRTTRRVELTPAGHVFLAEARLAVSHAEKAVSFARRAATGHHGSLTIGYTDFSINGPLPAIVAAFRKRYPQVEVKLQNQYTDQQMAGILEGRIDIGFALAAIKNPNVNQLTVVREPLVAVVPSEHPLAMAESIALEDLAEASFVLGTWERWRPYREMINGLCLSAGFLPNVAEEGADTMVLLGLVAANVGITIYPSCVRNFYRAGVTVRPLHGDLPLVETIMEWHQAASSPIVDRFLPVVEAWIEKERASSH